jgi:hypothetical protein
MDSANFDGVAIAIDARTAIDLATAVDCAAGVAIPIPISIDVTVVPIAAGGVGVVRREFQLEPGLTRDYRLAAHRAERTKTAQAEHSVRLACRDMPRGDSLPGLSDYCPFVVAHR